MVTDVYALNEAAWRNGGRGMSESLTGQDEASPVDQVSYQRLLRAVRQVISDPRTVSAVLARLSVSPAPSREAVAAQFGLDPLLLAESERRVNSLLTQPGLPAPQDAEVVFLKPRDAQPDTW